MRLLRDFPNLPRVVNILLFDSWNNELHDRIVSSKHSEVLYTVSSKQRSSEIFFNDLIKFNTRYCSHRLDDSSSSVLENMFTNKLASMDNVYTDTPNYNVVHVVPIEAFTMKSISTYSSDVRVVHLFLRMSQTGYRVKESARRGHQATRVKWGTSGLFRQKILEREIDNIINRHRPALQFPGRHGKVDSVWGRGWRLHL